jgi:hypothetical protein
MLRRVFASQSGKIVLSFPIDGFSCKMSIPLENELSEAG